MWNIGDVVTIGNKRYQVTECEGDKLKACYLCCAANKEMPCGKRYNYEGSSEEFWRGVCLEKLPENSYLKPLD